MTSSSAILRDYPLAPLAQHAPGCGRTEEARNRAADTYHRPAPLVAHSDTPVGVAESARTRNIGGAAWADPVHPAPRHDRYAHELPIGGSLSTVAVAMRQTEQRRPGRGPPAACKREEQPGVHSGVRR